MPLNNQYNVTIYAGKFLIESKKNSTYNDNLIKAHNHNLIVHRTLRVEYIAGADMSVFFESAMPTLPQITCPTEYYRKRPKMENKYMVRSSRRSWWRGRSSPPRSWCLSATARRRHCTPWRWLAPATLIQEERTSIHLYLGLQLHC